MDAVYVAKISLSPRRALNASEALLEAFDWSATEEGLDYWAEVFKKLEEMGCHAEIP